MNCGIKNMEQMFLSELASFCGGALIGPDIPVQGVSTDTRCLKSGDLFIPLVGERFDAHRFLNEAARECAAVLSAEDVSLPVPVIRVADTGAALLEIAAGYRRQFNLPLVGITGSTGKTTTKELTYGILSRKYNTVRTQGNYNNHIGVPLTILNIEKATQAAVVEMGMNHFGEISRLTKAACPTCAAITNVGSMHLEFLGTREGILQAKTEIFEGLPPDGEAILNADNDLLRELKGKLERPVVWFGIEDPGCDFRALDIRSDDQKTHFTLISPEGQIPVTLPAVGLHNVYNALAAAAAASCCGSSLSDMAAGIAAFENTGSRQKIFRIGEYTIIDDCYNAGPDSVAAALGVLVLTAKNRRIAVLGSMLELGDYSELMHLKTVERARAVCDLLFLYGDEMRPAAREHEHYSTHRALAEALSAAVRPGDTILFKGSRGMHMEEALSMFMEYGQ